MSEAASTTTAAPAEAAAGQPADASPAAAPAATPAEPAAEPGGVTGEGTEGASAEETSSEPAELGSEGKSGTDRPGGESGRYEYRRAAAAHLFGGDWVGRDKFVFHLSTGEESPPPRRLSARLEDFARYAFVPPAEWDRCRLDFRDRHTAVLCGAPGQGRFTMAVRLLQTVECGPIFELDPRIDLTRMAEQLTTQRLERGTGFLLHEPEDAARPDAYTLRSLEDTLAGAGARLVVTVGTDVSFPEDLLRYQLDLPPAPDRRLIVTQHLHHLVDEERTEQILAHPDVAKLFAETLDGDEVTCERAAVLALLLSRASDPIDVDEVASLLRRRVIDEFEIWFESLETLKMRCVAVALAVLDGLPYEDVADAARRLHQRLSSGGKVVLVEGSGLKVAGSDPFQLSQSRLQERLQARLEEATVHTPYGFAPATTIAYHNPDYPRQVIERAWKTYQIEDKLLDWLGELVSAQSPQVRTYAGTALGVVATLGFEHVRRRVLVPWAHDPDLWKNEAVADALRVAATVPELQPGVAWLVDGWYRNGSADARCTAALALGTQLGRPSATRSIQALERLAMVDDPSVRVGIARGFAALLWDAPETLGPEIYQVVRRCLADGERTFTGQYVFLFLAIDVDSDIPGDGGANTRWPTLLHLARDHQDLRMPLFECWARVLTEGRALAMAQRVLRAWAGRAEANLEVREAFVRMVRAVARLDARAGAVLARSAKQWNSDEELLPLPEVARAVSSVVSG